MSHQNLTILAKLSDAVREADAANLRAICADETRIRGQLTALDQRHKEAQVLVLDETLPLRRLGGDLLWQVWVGRRRRELQMQLAQCLARKGNARRALQKSFGKSTALADVQGEQHKAEDRARRARAFEKLTDLGIATRRSH